MTRSPKLSQTRGMPALRVHPMAPEPEEDLDDLSGAFGASGWTPAEHIMLAELGARLRQARKAMNLTIAAAAESVGLDSSYLGELERGRKNVSILTLRRLAVHYGLETPALLSPPVL